MLKVGARLRSEEAQAREREDERMERMTGTGFVAAVGDHWYLGGYF